MQQVRTVWGGGAGAERRTLRCLRRTCGKCELYAGAEALSLYRQRALLGEMYPDHYFAATTFCML